MKVIIAEKPSLARNIVSAITNMKTLLSGGEAALPIFDFATRRQIIGKKNMRLTDNEVIIVEGLHALNDVVTSRVGGGNLYKTTCEKTE